MSKTPVRLACLLVSLVASAQFALASEEGGAEPSIFAGDLGNAIWTLVIFVVVLFVLGKFAWGPILKALQHREEFIRDSLTSAKTEREEARNLLDEYTEKLNKAREDASAIVEEGRRDAEEVKKRIAQEARGEADAIIARAKREIGLARDSAVKELHSRTIELAAAVAGKIVRRQLTPADHKDLLDEAIADMQSLDN
ncbi:MAG: F0F1 ATP synthase subunit B [Planctomycetota bacterium]